jgi:hypothetical protein
MLLVVLAPGAKKKKEGAKQSLTEEPSREAP